MHGKDSHFNCLGCLQRLEWLFLTNRGIFLCLLGMLVAKTSHPIFSLCDDIGHYCDAAGAKYSSPKIRTARVIGNSEG